MYSYRAAAEVLRMYKLKLDFPRTTRVLLDKTASSGPVGAILRHLPRRWSLPPPPTRLRNASGAFGHIADECVCPSRQMPRPVDRLRLRYRARDDDRGSRRPVPVYPHKIDLDNTERLKSFERTTVVETLAELEAAVRKRRAEVG
jgi:hypothetical protein